MKRSLFVAIVILLYFIAPLSKAQQAPTPDYGSLYNGVYSNSFFGFSVRYPKGWVVHGDATNRHLREFGKERAVGTGALPAELAEVMLKSTYQLLTTFQYALGTPNIEVNPSFIVVAENVSHAPAIVDGRDYLLYVRPLMIKQGFESIREEPIQLVLAGRKFFRQDSRMQVGGMTIQQAIIITVINGYALAFILTGNEQQSIDGMANAVSTLKFDDVPPIRRGVTTVLGHESPSSPAKPEPSPSSSHNKSKTRPVP
jgi:hypothetical protein